MKAILVIDIFDDVNKYHADIYREDDKGNGEMIATYIPFKPMPKRVLEVVQMQNGNIVNIQETSFANGWNACLEEIEK